MSMSYEEVREEIVRVAKQKDGLENAILTHYGLLYLMDRGEQPEWITRDEDWHEHTRPFIEPQLEKFKAEWRHVSAHLNTLHELAHMMERGKAA